MILLDPVAEIAIGPTTHNFAEFGLDPNSGSWSNVRPTIWG
jgi:hypothetical protein